MTYAERHRQSMQGAYDCAVAITARLRSALDAAITAAPTPDIALPDRPSKPTKADRMLVARHMRREADRLRRLAESLRHNAPGRLNPAAFLKFATQHETRAARFERVADWVAGDGE